ncbi:MAG: exopolyphosphatase/guanosine-5'-triphosphate,3'-diphosphate pyrophosphatase [Myxococcota bacterium]|jgi:exopolyphosphatase/guanosine-5'-triphosphate,3'-diphosphate pyrophosphatase
MRRSVLDLGSNSFHVLVADVSVEGYIDPVMRERQMLHLGRVVAELGRIPDDLADVAVESVADLSELARRTGATEHHAVATSALRDARNGPELIDRMSEAAGTHIEVIPGHEEARLSYLGVRAALGVAPAGLAVLDLGGGSLELAIGTQRTPDLVTTTKLGVSRLSTLVRNDPMQKMDRRRLSEAITSELELSGGAFETQLPGRVVAVGGTVRALARVIAAEDHDWVPMTLNRLPVKTDRLLALRRELQQLDRGGRAAVPGMKTRRADHAHVAATILGEVLKQLGVERFEVCDWGLREGVLLDRAGTDLAPAPSALRAREVLRLHDAFRTDMHCRHTADLAVQLWDVTAQLHGLEPHDRELLHHAAVVHGVGSALALRKHQMHAAYIVAHAELRGFSPTMCAQLVTLARFQSSGGIDRTFPAAASLDDTSYDRTVKLLALLQAAKGLNRTEDNAVTSLTLGSVDDDSITIVLHGDGLDIAHRDLARRTRLFQRTFGRELKICRKGAS